MLAHMAWDLKQRPHVQADVFAFGVILYEVFSSIITSTVVVGPTFSPNAAEIYALKVKLKPLLTG